MGRKQDFLAVLSGRPCSRLPLWELHFHMWNQYSSEKVILGREFLALDERGRQRAIERSACAIAQTAQALGFGAVSIPDAPWDCWYTLPQPYRLLLVEKLRALQPDFAIVSGGSGVLSMPSDASQYVNFCYRLFDDEEGIDRDCEALFSGWLQSARALAQAGVDAMYIAADVADNRTTFFNRAQLERWYFPYLRRCAGELRRMGVAPVLHTDGNISSILSDLRESGIDGLQAIDPVAGMDIAAVKRALAPRVTVCGNVDCGCMLSGTPDEVYRQTAALIERCFDGTRFILGNSNAVTADTPRQNYDAYLRAWRERSALPPR